MSHDFGGAKIENVSYGTNPGDVPSVGQVQRACTILRVTPTSGQTVTIPTNALGDVVVIVAPATDLATLTLAWPPSPLDGQNFRILFTKTITALYHTGGSLNRSAPTAPATGDMSYMYDSSGATFMCTSMTQSTTVALPFTASTAGGAGNAVFYATDSGLVGGNALFSSIQYIQPMFTVANPNDAFSLPVVSNANKTITTNCQRQTFTGVTILGINAVGTNIVGNAPNGVALSFLVRGVLA